MWYLLIHRHRIPGHIRLIQDILMVCMLSQACRASLNSFTLGTWIWGRGTCDDKVDVLSLLCAYIVPDDLACTGSPSTSVTDYFPAEPLSNR